MTPEETVKFAEEAHASLDIERMLACFDPEAVVYWNGEQVASGMDELRAFYQAQFGNVVEFTLKKTLRAATGDTIAVEWTHTRVDTEGDKYEAVAGEFWKMKDDKLIEWHAYCIESKV
ncbi:MAG: nuclear transport factor 2 family protein [Pseudomonadota bacterium]